MNMEQLRSEPSLEESKAISVERTSAGSISIEVSKGASDHFFGITHSIQSIVEDKGLFEVIPNEETGTIEVRSFNPAGELPEEMMIEIQTQIDKLNPIF